MISLKQVVFIVIGLLCLVQLSIVLSDRFGTATTTQNPQGQVADSSILFQLSLELKEASDRVARSADELARLRVQGVGVPAVAPPLLPTSVAGHEEAVEKKASTVPTHAVEPPVAAAVKAEVPVELVASTPPVPVHVHVPDAAPRTGRPAVLRRAAIFTMDSFPAYEENSRRGGAAGELLIRHSLQHAFDKLGRWLGVYW
jgi:hypothetical protein